MQENQVGALWFHVGDHDHFLNWTGEMNVVFGQQGRLGVYREKGNNLLLKISICWDYFITICLT